MDETEFEEAVMDLITKYLKSAGDDPDKIADKAGSAISVFELRAMALKEEYPDGEC